MRLHPSLRAMAAAMAVLLGVTTFAWNLRAAELIGTDEVLRAGHASDQRARVQAFLQREDVRAQFAALGVNGDEAAARVATLSDAEVQRISDRMDTMPAGQIDVLGLVLTVLIVLLVTDLLGVTHVYPFIHK
jgi:Family of unknown function (DUF6627)